MTEPPLIRLDALGANVPSARGSDGALGYRVYYTGLCAYDDKREDGARAGTT